MKNFVYYFILLSLILGGFSYCRQDQDYKPPRDAQWGDKIDSLHGVYVYYNDRVSTVRGRNTSAGYNLGLKHQCVEFVKRYYFEHYQHRMPNSYGHAKSFFNNKLTDGQLNKSRGLIQFSNPSVSKPAVGDLIVFDGHLFNKYGHVAIVSQVNDRDIQIIQQNPGPRSPSRINLRLKKKEGKYEIKKSSVLGWLRKQ